MLKDNWIWLDKNIYPDLQSSSYTGNWQGEGESEIVVEFSREYDLACQVEYIELSYSADAVLQLWVNDRFVGTGPVNVGGDFLGNDMPRKNRYKSELILTKSGDDDYIRRRLTIPYLEEGRLKFVARVRLSPTQICDFSMGRGGFMLSCDIHFSDGEVMEIATDESWRAYLLPSCSKAGEYDGGKERIECTPPSLIEDIWRATSSFLPHRVERRRTPDKGENVITLVPGETREITLEFDKILAGYTWILARTSGEIIVELSISELVEDSEPKRERLIFTADDEFIGTRMYSFGVIRAKLVNNADSVATLDIGINEAYLPSSVMANTYTSDDELNKILSLSAHTLKYCRQYIHLDSPKHCEPLACTGDYLIEALMTSFSFGDMALADFDVCRTARAIEHNCGEMFHPTYSLLWARMLLEVYLRCGRVGLLSDCEVALDLLIDTFRGYTDDDGIIDTPPSFMFVDWIFVDGFSLHHPPKALGQSVINMLYYDALISASRIYKYLGREEKSERIELLAGELKSAINIRLYDASTGLYFEGENTPTPSERVGLYMPQNTDKRYYRINANILACALGIIEGDEARELVRRLLSSDEFSDYQPYFAHFVLLAVHRTGLDGEYLFKILDKWRDPVRQCDKGLAEGFIPPSDDYAFDHSHAWGGTPLYSLPMALTSLEINEAGMKEITLCPRLLGLEYARVEIPTPYGIVALEMREGEKPEITSPPEIKINISE